MEIADHVITALGIAVQPGNLLYCFYGVLIGNFIGVLPGLGPIATMSLLLPITYRISPTAAIIMLSGIYYGAQYGGSTTSILLNIPGEASTVVTCLDGYEMAKKGRAGAALSIAAIGSFIGGTFGVIMLTLIAPPLAEMALKFGPLENTALLILGITMITFLSSGSMIKALMMVSLGLLLGCIGTDLITGRLRFILGFPELSEGLDIAPVAMGLFGISEVMLNIEKEQEKRHFFKMSIKGMLLSKQELKESVGPVARGSILGFFLGLLPGGGALLGSFVSYIVEKKLSKYPDKFGTGYIPGVAGPETANNAGSQGGFIPLLTLGLPCNTILAILMGAFMVHGIIPGPLLMTTHPDLFWGVVGSMYIGNAMLLVLNLPLIGLWLWVLRVPYSLLFPLILLFCLIGAYSVEGSIFNVSIMIIFGILGYLLKKLDYPPAPLVLALVLGPMLEKGLGQSLMMSKERSLTIFLSSPIAAVLLTATVILLLLPLILKLLRKKRTEFSEE